VGNIGVTELLLIGLVAIVPLGGIAAVIALVVFLTRRQGQPVACRGCGRPIAFRGAVCPACGRAM
jgi:hypothetical protein